MPGLIDEFVAYFKENGVDLALRVGGALLILLVALIAGKLVSRGAARAIQARGRARSRTLAPIVKTVVFVLVFSAGLITALAQIGINVAALLAGAGILGLAIGFGAQGLVKDLLSGFFLIFDNVVDEGDVVEADGHFGVVEQVSLRVTQVRGYNGGLWYLRNGSIDVVGNYNRSWVRAIVEVGLAYEQDAARGMRVLQEVGDAWAAENAELVVEPPEAQGLLALGDSSVGVRLVIKIDSEGSQKWPVERELARRLKAAFEESGVEIAFPRHVVYHRSEPDTALRIESSAGAPPP